MSELERLRADLATIRAAMEIYDRDYRGTDNSALIGIIEKKIARLEAEADSMSGIRAWVEEHRGKFGWPSPVADHVCRLEFENARLAARVAGLEAARLTQGDYNRIIEWFGALQDTRTQYLDAYDYKLAKAIYDSCGRTVPGSVLNGCGLTDVHAAKADPDDPILDPARVLATAAEVYSQRGMKSIASMCRFDANNAKPYRLKGDDDAK